jgi:CheY-like chemotaxis protein
MSDRSSESEAVVTPQCLIMVINGSQELLELFREILEEFGDGQYTCSLHALADVHHVNIVRESQPHLILIDQPFNDLEMRGWELVQKIRMARDLRTIPLIFMTTNVRLMQELEAQLIALDVRTLLKPFDPDHLLRLVRSTLADQGVLAPDGTINEAAAGE